MVDPSGGLVTGLLSQVLGDLASDLLESLAHNPRGAGLVEDPIRMEPRRPDPLRPRRLGSAELDRLVTGLADRFTAARRGAENQLPDHEWVAALAAVRDTLARSAPLDATLVVTAARLDPGRLELLVRRAGADVRRAAALSAAAEAVYDEMLRVGCAHIVEFITARREFTVWANRQTIQQTGEILDQVNRLRTSLASDVVRAGNTLEQSARDEADVAFTRRYAEFVISRLDALEVVGVTLRQTPRQYALEAAYTNLSVARAVTPDGRPVESEGLTGSGIPVTDILPSAARAVLRGAAGSGKTTTVQWLAVGAARDLLAGADRGPDLAKASKGPVPFMIPLRRFVSRGLPSPGEFLSELARPLAHAAPAGWIDRMLLGPRALIMVDGVDEVPSQSLGEATPVRTLRSDVETWLGELVAAYPGARFVVTSRVSAIPEEWLGNLGFDTFDLLPMGPNGIRDLIERWHDAVSAGLPAGQVSLLEQQRASLPVVITSRPELHRLAATPLLCALICALNWDRQMELPTDRAGIYEAALDMLLDRRDVQRGVSAPEGIELGAREQSVMLQRLAFHLVKNEISEIPVEAARAQLARVMPRIKSREADPTDVLRHLLARTGLLREDPLSGGVHFIHRTFQDYLGAREALEEGDIGLLVHRGHDDRWVDVIVMAAAQARPRECGTILTGLLDRGDREPAARERLHLVAAAAMAQSVVVEPAPVRQRVERATAALIPPTSNQGAQALARAGEFVVDLLPGPDGLDEQAAAYVVRTAALIGTEAARDLILRFIPGEPAPRIVDELLRAWRATPQPEDYARTVLAPVRFGDVTVAVHRHRLPYLRHLPHLHSVRYLGDLVDLESFTQMPALRRLELFQNDALRDRHLSVLSGCSQLRELVLVRCGSLRDLSGLAEVGLTKLTLTFLDLVDVRSLEALRSVRDLSLRLRRVSDLQLLPVLLPLRRLAFGGRLPEATLAGIERFTGLEEVELIGVPSPSDVERLARLPRLSTVTVAQDLSADDARWIDALRSARPGLLITSAVAAAPSQVA